MKRIFTLILLANLLCSHFLEAQTWNSGSSLKSTQYIGSRMLSKGDKLSHGLNFEGVDLIDNIYQQNRRNAYLPAAAITGSTSICISGTSTLSDTTTGGHWYSSLTSVATIDSNTGVVTGITAGTSTIYYISGADSANVTITVVSFPVAGVISGDSTVCNSSSITLTDIVSGGVWSSSSATGGATVSAGVVTGTSAGTDTIHYSITNACGTATAIKIITINPLPSVHSIVGSMNICFGTTDIYTDSTISGIWGIKNTHAAITTSGIVAPISAGTDTIFYAVANSCGVDTAFKTIHILTLPVAGTISGIASFCISHTDSLSDSTAGGVWTSVNTLIANVDSISGVVNGVASGIDTIKYTVSNACGSAHSDFVITVQPTPDAGIISALNDTLCLGGSYLLSETVSGGVWHRHHAAVDSVDTFGNIFARAIGRDTVFYTVTNGCGSSSATFPIKVIATTSSGTITGPTSVCTGATVPYTADSTGGNWTLSDYTIGMIDGLGNFTGFSTGTEFITYSLPRACKTNAIAMVNIIASPDAGVISGPNGLCLPTGGAVALTNFATGGVWSSSNPSVATVDSFGNVSGYSYGTVNISYTVSNSCGTAVDTFKFSVDIPVIGLFGTPTICQGGTTPTIYIGSPAGGTYSSSNFLVAPIIAIPGTGTGGAYGLAVGTVTMSYTMNNSCGITVATMDVNIIKCDSTHILVPTINSLNDGLEVYPNPNTGTFVVKYIAPTDEIISLCIYNVAGQKVKGLTFKSNIETEIDLNEVSGMYFVEAKGASGNIMRKKIVVAN